MEPTETLIELIDANISRAEAVHPQVLVQDVNWTIRRGDFWTVAGLPGSGKTDLLATAAGLQKVLSGTHLIFGKDIRHLSEDELVKEKLKIGFVFGSGRLFPKTTIAENIALPICYHLNCTYEQAEPKVRAALKLTGLEDSADRKPRDMTRNMHQRIGLARALALGPELLMIDNPLQGVDPRLGRWWIDFLSQLSRGHELLGGRPMTIALATDDLRPWRAVGSQFAVINGKKWKQFSGNEELNRFDDAVLKELMS
jgi:ABC-type transporter Mla maintaining outer membrane lipid asymmetry ATPase subunit MlaF